MGIKKVFAVLPLTIVFFTASVLISAGTYIFEGSLNKSVYAEEQGINQSASTSGGTVKRHIDISSPFSGGYLHEDMTVEGEASITESFTMDNISPGTNAGSGLDDWDTGPSGGSSDSSVEVDTGSGSIEGSSSTGSGNNTGSNSSESSKVASEEEASPQKDAVLGISIFACPSWLDLF
ncbi:MAG: hypothetical protein ACQES4_07910 [Bacillota bacterium]